MRQAREPVRQLRAGGARPLRGDARPGQHVPRPQHAARRAGLQPARRARRGLPVLGLLGQPPRPGGVLQRRTRTARSGAASSWSAAAACARSRTSSSATRSSACSRSCSRLPLESTRSARDARHRGDRLMQKSAPSFGRIAAMVLFALSCFGLVLFLWLAFGGPVPLKPKGYRVTASFAEAAAARHGGRRADLRRPGRQGQGDRGRHGDRAAPIVTFELDAEVRAAARRRAGDPAPEDAAGRDLRRAHARHEVGAEAGRGRPARRGPGVRDRRARRDPAHVRARDARGLPGLDAVAGRGDRRPRARPQRRARATSGRSPTTRRSSSTSSTARSRRCGG